MCVCVMCLSFSPSLWISKELIESQLRIGTFLHGLQEAQRGTHEPRRFEKWKMVFGDLVPPVMAQKTGKIQDILVGGFNLPLWKMMEFVSWDGYSQYMET